MMRSPVSLSRLRFTPGAEQVVYTHKGGHDTAESTDDEGIDAEESVARVLVQIPDPKRHLVRYYGAYSTTSANATGSLALPHASSRPSPTPPESRLRSCVHHAAKGGYRPGKSPTDPWPQPRLASPRLWARHPPIGPR